LIDYEFQSAMRRAVRLGGLPAATAAAALRAFAGLNLVRHPAARLASRMWDMRDTVTTYDSAYVALAEALDVPLMTADRRLARAASMYCAVLAV
jgi:predicted nucleic acid-binding protein